MCRADNAENGDLHGWLCSEIERYFAPGRADVALCQHDGGPRCSPCGLLVYTGMMIVGVEMN